MLHGYVVAAKVRMRGGFGGTVSCSGNRDDRGGSNQCSPIEGELFVIRLRLQKFGERNGLEGSRSGREGGWW